MLVPTLQEVQAGQLGQINECARRIQMPGALREAVSARIGAPVGQNCNIVVLAQLTDAERDNAVDDVELPDGAPAAGQLQQHRPPTPRVNASGALASTPTASTEHPVESNRNHSNHGSILCQPNICDRLVTDCHQPTSFIPTEALANLVENIDGDATPHSPRYGRFVRVT